MSKTALLEAPKLADPVPGREVKAVWAHRETPSCCSGSAKQAPPPAPTLALRLRAHLSSLTALEACALLTLVHRRATGEDTLLKCAAAETGVSEALPEGTRASVSKCAINGWPYLNQSERRAVEHVSRMPSRLDRSLCSRTTSWRRSFALKPLMATSESFWTCRCRI